MLVVDWSGAEARELMSPTTTTSLSSWICSWIYGFFFVDYLVEAPRLRHHGSGGGCHLAAAAAATNLLLGTA